MKTTWRRAGVAALTATVLWCGAAAAIAQDTYSWVWSQKVGDALKFRTYVRITARQADNSGDIVITTRSESRHDYKAVAEDGTITYEQLDEKAEAILNGAPIPPAAAGPKPVTITLGKNGVMAKRVNPAADPFDRSQKSIIALMAMPAPPKPVAVGESWKTDIPNPLMKGKIITITSTLVGIEKVLGKDAIRVKQESTFPSVFGADENETLVVKGEYWLDAADKSLLKMSYNVKNPVLPFPAAKIQSIGLVHRIVPGVNDKEDAEGEKLYFQPKADK
ncbi:MAG: hypothetical protein ACKO5K_11045 [Armatimonadota bacterium]